MTHRPWLGLDEDQRRQIAMEVAMFAMEVENMQLAKELKAAKKAKGMLKLEGKRKEFDKKRWKATTESMLRAWPGVPATIYNPACVAGCDGPAAAGGQRAAHPPEAPSQPGAAGQDGAADPQVHRTGRFHYAGQRALRRAGALPEDEGFARRG